MDDYGSSLEAQDNEILPSETPDLPPQPKSRFQNRKTLIILAGVIFLGIAIVSYLVLKPSEPAPQEPPREITVNTQSLDAGTLNKLTSQLEPGPVRQQLTIDPDTLFRNSVVVDKNLLVKGTTTLQDAVSMDKDLTVSGQLKVGGATSIGGNLSVNGQISAGSLNVGTLTLTSIQLDGNLTMSGHLITKGSAPAARAGAASGGGRTSVNGNDTSGTITITIGNNPMPAGELATVTFNSRFSNVPRIQLTPVSVGASRLDYFVAKTPGFFTIESTSQPTPGQSYSFDYFVSE